MKYQTRMAAVWIISFLLWGVIAYLFIGFDDTTSILKVFGVAGLATLFEYALYKRITKR